MAMIRIRSGSQTKRDNGYDLNTIRKPPSGLWHCADQRGIDIYDSNTTRKPPSDHNDYWLWFEYDQEARLKGLMAMIRIRSSPQVACDGLMAMIWIRSGSRTKRVNGNDLNMIKTPSGLWWFNGYDSNTIRKPNQKGYCNDSNTINPPSDHEIMIEDSLFLKMKWQRPCFIIIIII